MKWCTDYNTAWINFEDFMLSKRKPVTKYHLSWLHLHEIAKRGKYIEIEGRLIIALGWKYGTRIKLIARSLGMSFRHDEIVLKLTVMTAVLLHHYVKNH